MTSQVLMVQMRKGALEGCILALLQPGERYGLELMRLLQNAPGLGAADGTVYPILARLRRSGLVETYWRESRGGPPRRYYRLTATGQVAAEGFRRAWIEFRRGVDAILA